MPTVSSLTSRPRGSGSDLTVLDLFAGAGGLSRGLLEAGGFVAVQAVEMDVAAAATYSANHRDTSVFQGPIQQWLDQCEVPEVDVIVGGPPCQGFSTLGRQDVADDRNALWYEYAKTIARARPRWFVVENVDAFRRSPQFELFLGETRPGGMLQDWRFDSTHGVVNAADYGAFQARRRTLLIGHRRDVSPAWPQPAHTGNHRTVQSALTGVSAEVDGIDLPDRTTSFGGRVLPGAYQTSELHLGRRYTQLSLDRFRAIPAGGNRFNLPIHLQAPCWQRHTSGSGDVMGRLRPDRPSVTIRTEFYKPEKGRYIHPSADRAITHFEAALLQGFPREYLWVGSKTQIARQIGNAVPVQLAQAVGRAIKDAAET